MKQHSSKMKKRYSPLIGAALAAASLFHFSLPAFAAGTSAGQGLVNKATATYSDAEENNYDVISNEVTVTVGKVAGITNVATGNTSTGAILAGQSIGFDFTITNTGNDVSSIFIPDTTTIGNYAGTTDNLTVNSVQYSTDGGANFEDRPTDGIVPNIAEDASIIVRVGVTVDSGAADGADIAVQLGNTGDNDNSVDTQNQPDVVASSPDTASDDVRTVTATGNATNPTDTLNVPGDPVNGQREASAVNTTQVNAVPLTLPRITKTDGGVDQNGTPRNVSDDIITYNLDLDVLNDGLADYTSPNFNFSFKDLEGRDYSSATSTDPTSNPVINPATTTPDITDLTNLILVSDAIPADTTLDVSSVTAPSANWIPIYSQSPLTTPAEEAAWYEDPTDDPGSDAITRVGWVYDASADANGPIAQNTSITGFSFEVETTDLTGTTDVYNMAQVFGTTDDEADGTTDGTVVLDESGDQNPSNFNDDGNGRSPQTTTSNDGGTTLYYGYAINTPGAANIDPGSNTGTGAAGEFDEVTVSIAAEATSAILNGPGEYLNLGIEPAPDALGKLFLADTATADDNHDFQNLSTNTPAVADLTNDGVDGNVDTEYNPDSKKFNNSVQNNSGGTTAIDVVLEPISPGYDGLGGADGDLPNNTQVTIEYDNAGTTETALYTYNASTGEFTTNDTPITISGIDPDEIVDYIVRVDLPTGTQLSTSYVDGDPANELNGGYPVPIVAYTDPGDDGLDLTITDDTDTDDSYNITINQVYTGFLQLDKTATIIGLTNPEDPNSAIDEVDRDPIPGDIIQYDITYTNISEEVTSTEIGSIALTADDLKIIEDGTTGDATSSNNWALDNDGDGIIDTLHVAGEAGEVDSGTDELSTSSSVQILYTNDANTENTSDTALTGEIVRYQYGGTNGIDGIEPGEESIFRFQRKVTEASDSDS